MPNREHMPGYAPSLDNEPLRAHDRQPFPLGVPDRFKAEVKKRIRGILDDVMGPALMDPLTLTHLQPSDVPGVLIAAGPDHVKASLQRIADAGKDPSPAALAIYHRAERERELEVADAALDFMRERSKAITAAEHARRNAAMAAAHQQTQLHPQAGAMMGQGVGMSAEAMKAIELCKQQGQAYTISGANAGAMGLSAQQLAACNIDKPV